MTKRNLMSDLRRSITVGTRVAFSREFCRNTGQLTGWTPFARGKVIAVDRLSCDCIIACVAWDGGAAGTVNVKNLVREDMLHLERV